MADIDASLLAAAAMIESLRQREDVLARVADALIGSLRGGGKILTCGNGGSAAEAMHLAEELVGRFSRHRRALPAFCLSADATALTCIANDYGYECAFSRQVEALGRPGDALVVLSTSGRSPSIVRALTAARSAGVTTIGLLGPRGSPAEPVCDLALTLDGVPAPRVQEAHLITIHLCLERIDAAFDDARATGAE